MRLETWGGEVIDLKRLASDRYRTELDESASMEPSRVERLWLARIPGRYGFVSVHSATELAAFTDRRLMVGRLIAVEGVRVHQRGDSEVRVVFAPDRLDAIAELLQARRKRHLSPENKAKAIARLETMRRNPATERAPAAL